MADFKLGVVTVEVTTRDGATHIEDWAPDDAAAANDYAAETAHCTDVLRTEFRAPGQHRTYGVAGGNSQTFQQADPDGSGSPVRAAALAPSDEKGTT